jgi:hypothetical protein
MCQALRGPEHVRAARDLGWIGIAEARETELTVFQDLRK